MTFDEAFDILMEHEGGYSNHPSDPGGETMWGVTKRVALQEGYLGEMRLLPKETAKAIYKKKYWDAVHADELPEPIRYTVFDAAVNSGPKRAIQWLQQALGVGEDGVVGPVTVDGKGGWGLCRKHYKQERNTLIKDALIELFGNRCQKCLNSFHRSVYDFHHVGDKSNSPSSLIASNSLERIANELSQCIMLCANCHRLEHHGL